MTYPPENQKITNRHDAGNSRREIGFENQPMTENTKRGLPFTRPPLWMNYLTGDGPHCGVMSEEDYANIALQPLEINSEMEGNVLHVNPNFCNLVLYFCFSAGH